jgi:hypothetical protein
VEKMGPLLEQQGESLLSNRNYLTADSKEKKALFKQLISEYRSASKEIVRGERPDLAIREAVKRTEEFLREELGKKLKE